MEGGGFRAAICHLYPNADIFRRFSCIDDFHIPVAIFRKGAGIENTKRFLLSGSTSVFADQFSIGKFGLWILIEILQKAVTWGGIKVEETLLDVFTPIALLTGQAEHPFLEEGISTVPEGHGQT